MKIVVDKIPKSPKECMFSKRNVEVGYVCTLRPYIEEAKGKLVCVCKPVFGGGVLCDRLVTLESIMEESYVK